VARSMVGLDNLFLNRVKIGEGFGVPAVAVDSDLLNDAVPLRRPVDSIGKGPQGRALWCLLCAYWRFRDQPL
jgi:hypothetical protein